MGLSVSEYYELVIVLIAVLGTALVAKVTNLPITALEIVAGIVLIGAFGFTAPTVLAPFTALGSLLIVFLAGLETRLDYLRQNLRKAVLIGIPGFVVPFAGLWVLLDVGFHLPALIATIGATALADTSISIVYTTLHQYGLADLPFGRLVLASTLLVNLTEDSTITSATLWHNPGAIVLTLLVLAGLTGVALLFPQLQRLLQKRTSATFTNITTRTSLLGLLVLGLFSAMVSIPGILFVFLMGLIFSQYADRGFVLDLQKFAFAIFVPLYFLAVGLEVNIAFVFANLPILLIVAGVASALKLAGVFGGTRAAFGGALGAQVAVLMNTRLTSATVILLLTLDIGLLPDSWYSLFISCVVILALGASGVLRAFPTFASAAEAQKRFRALEGPVEDANPVPVPSGS
jgi:Kef-type K+ transport system membrane component KefB